MPHLTNTELEDLNSVGYVEGNFATFPINVSSILKAKAMADWKEAHPEDSQFDIPDPIEDQNNRVRERAAADGDKVMQEYLGIKDEEPKTTEQKRQVKAK